MFNESMSEDLTDQTPVYSRHRVKNFQNKEVELLINLISKYKHVLLHKSKTAKACEAKDIAWQQLAKEFNSHHLGKERSAESLKTKFRNIGNGQYVNSSQSDELSFRKEMYERYKAAIDTGDSTDSTSGGFVGVKAHIRADKNEFEDEKDSIFNSKISEDDSNDDKPILQSNKNKINDKKFTMRECQLLLKCVKQERRTLFSVTGSTDRKRQAWKRICESYNEKTDRKRTWMELQRRFQTMKSVTSRICKNNMFSKKKEKYESLNNGATNSNIKLEVHSDSSDCNFDDNESHRNVLIEVNPTNTYSDNDPLTTNGSSLDSGLGSSDYLSNKDVNRMQLELWNYKMETAKMERKRLEQAKQAEQSERESRAIEMSLKLRTARLEMLAAEAKFDPNSPALAYSAQEARCQAYMQEFMHNSG